MKATIKSLTEQLAAMEKSRNDCSQAQTDERRARNAAESQVKETREQFVDLKKRLHNAETEVSRLNGYIARVREDDTVREELVTVGDPDGERRMIPKRKHEYLGNRELDSSMSSMMGGEYDSYGNKKRNTKHWIEY